MYKGFRIRKEQVQKWRLLFSVWIYGKLFSLFVCLYCGHILFFPLWKKMWPKAIEKGLTVGLGRLAIYADWAIVMHTQICVIVRRRNVSTELGIARGHSSVVLFPSYEAPPLTFPLLSTHWSSANRFLKKQSNKTIKFILNPCLIFIFIHVETYFATLWWGLGLRLHVCFMDNYVTNSIGRMPAVVENLVLFWQ